jgi:hypothetical protein
MPTIHYLCARLLCTLSVTKTRCTWHFDYK